MHSASRDRSTHTFSFFVMPMVGRLTQSPAGGSVNRPYLIMTSVQSVTIRVPASTSNLGPGFDCLGVALRVYNLVTLSRATKRESLGPIAGQAAGTFFN